MRRAVFEAHQFIIPLALEHRIRPGEASVHSGTLGDQHGQHDN